MKSEKLCIVGQTGSGKNFLLRGLIEKGLTYEPKITTRPRRKLEREGIDYYFYNNRRFESLLEKNEIKLYQEFNINNDIWYYGLSCNNFDKNQLFIMTPHEISNLSTEDRKKCFIVYLDIDEDTRRKRLINRRDNNDSIERRIKSDKEDFKFFSDYDLKITDPTFETWMIYDLMN